MNATARSGKQFEIWLEQLLRGCGIQTVQRDIRFRSASGATRQVDLAFQTYAKGRPHLSLVEAKYTRTERVNGQYRSGPVVKRRRDGVNRHYIDSLVDELRERQAFVHANATYLMTNAHFDEKTRRDAQLCKIVVYEREALTRLYRRAGGRLPSIDDSIRQVNVRSYRPQPLIVSLPDVLPTTTRHYIAQTRTIQHD